ncbi:exodeoxyribonuclease VII, large subunit domain protein [Leptospira interrogans serovar Bataviae str. HAI135]|nr:exodeoxyribonuclease VII, large subunit domain protein [Leptospira interrogans serovar Bataviae str. HAI135]
MEDSKPLSVSEVTRIIKNLISGSKDLKISGFEEKFPTIARPAQDIFIFLSKTPGLSFDALFSITRIKIIPENHYPMEKKSKSTERSLYTKQEVLIISM